MQPIRKKPVKDKRWLWLLLLGLLMLLTALYLIFNKTQTKGPLVLANDEQELLLINQDAADIQRIEISPSAHPAYSLVQRDGSFHLENIHPFELDAVQLESIIKDLSQLYVNELAGRVHVDEASLALLGLGQDASRARVEYVDGSSYVLVFGNSAHTEPPSDFLMLEGDDQVYLASPGLKDQFERDVKMLHQLPSIAFRGSLLNQARFVGDAGFSLKQQDGLWSLEQPFSYPLNQGAVHAFLDALEGMRMAVYAGEATEENLVNFGFKRRNQAVHLALAESLVRYYDENGIEVDQERVPAQELVFSLGDDIKPLGFYCSYRGKIYQVSSTSMGFLRDTEFISLLSAHPITIPVNRLQSIRVTKDKRSSTYDVQMVEKILPDNQFQRDEMGNIIHEAAIEKDGQEMSSQTFLEAYLRLMALDSRGSLPEGFSIGEQPPLLVYHVEYLGGQMELALYPFDALHLAMQVNGTFVYYCSKEMAMDIGL